jgi:hypothetical protein
MLRRYSWPVVAGGVFALACLIVAAIAGYWRYANQLPSYPRPAVVLPVPNAYDDYVEAGQLCRSAGAATVTSIPGGRREAYERGVPLAQVHAVVERNRPALVRLRQGFKRQARNPILLSFTVNFPELADFRSLARVLVSEGKLSERERRPNEAARSYLDCVRLGLDVERGGLLIHGLVGLAIQDIGLDHLNRVADRLDAPTAAAAAREMERLDRQAPTLAGTLRAEKEYVTVSLLQTFQQEAPGQVAANLAGGGGAAPSGSQLLLGLRYSLTPKKRILENIRGHMDALIADAGRSYYRQKPLPPIPGDPVSGSVLPVFTGLKAQWVRRDAQRRMTQLQLAARAYTLRHGASPPSAAALVPGYLTAVPPDPYAPQPMVYRRPINSATIERRGPDGGDGAGPKNARNR